MSNQLSFSDEDVTQLVILTPVQSRPFFFHCQRVKTPDGEGTAQFRRYLENGDWVYVVSFPSKLPGRMWELREYKPEQLTAA